MIIDRQKILYEHLDRIVNKFRLDKQFWFELKDSKIFPSEYIDYIQNENGTEENKKKNLLIDLIRRPPSSYNSFSRILQKLYENDVLEQLIYFNEKGAYPIINEQPGICLIINNEIFNNHLTRSGSKIDVDKFKKQFEKLNYNVITRSDLSRNQFLDLLKEQTKKKELVNQDIFVAIIMSHGVSENVITSDGEKVGYDEIFELFSNENCPGLFGKPKIFIFNCCRSPQIHSMNNNEQTIDSCKTNREFKTFSDVFKVFSTLNSLYSVRDEENGTFFATAFTEAMKENSHSDVSEISIKANTKLETLVNDPKNKVETRQTIEFGSLYLFTLIPLVSGHVVFAQFADKI